MEDRVQLELNLSPAYVWGASGLAIGAPGDCSGKLYAIFFSCGVPVQRVTAAQIAQGLGGWDFAPVVWDEAQKLAIINMTLKPDRIDGHVALILQVFPVGKIKAVHASSGKKRFVLEMVDQDHFIFRKHSLLHQTSK